MSYSEPRYRGHTGGWKPAAIHLNFIPGTPAPGGVT